MEVSVITIRNACLRRLKRDPDEQRDAESALAGVRKLWAIGSLISDLDMQCGYSRRNFAMHTRVAKAGKLTGR
jgi:hypothetical protein